MADVLQILEDLRRRIADSNDPAIPAEFASRLAVTPSAGDVDLDYFGDSFDEAYADLLKTVARVDVAPHVRALFLRGPDEGANGTRNWDLEPLLATGATFDRLETLAVAQNGPADHNRSVIGSGYEEDGVLGRLLARAPSLRDLTVPSAPDQSFFEVGPRPIRFLSVDAGYATQSFVRNLAESSVFGQLYCLEWGEYNETSTEDFDANCTPLQDFYELFRSSAFSTVKRLVWRNPASSAGDIRALKLLRPDLQLLVVRTSAEYV